jgi:hypothetical protein
MEDQFKELRDSIDGRFDRIEVRFNKVDGQFDQIEARFNKVDGQFDQMREYAGERARDIETHLLVEFRKWALRIEATLKPLPSQISGLETRLGLVEERLDKLDNHGMEGLSI